MKSTKTNTNTLPVGTLKLYTDIFSPVIANLTTECFTKRVLPESLEVASIPPALKKGDDKLTSNYRPLFFLPYLSKLIGKLIHSASKKT